MGKITRSRLYQRNARFQWKWIYQVNGDHDCDTLAQAKEIAKRLYGGWQVSW